jgi:hypothetical protein
MLKIISTRLDSIPIDVHHRPVKMVFGDEFNRCNLPDGGVSEPVEL